MPRSSAARPRGAASAVTGTTHSSWATTCAMPTVACYTYHGYTYHGYTYHGYTYYDPRLRGVRVDVVAHVLEAHVALLLGHIERLVRVRGVGVRVS